jgi:hypothetical protein
MVTLLAGAGPDSTSDKPGFTPLLNGKDLQGWTYGTRNHRVNKSGKGYQVENGITFCTVDDGGDLFTEKEYANFILRFEFKLTENANNGIGIRAPFEGDAAYVGMEIQILDDSGTDYKSLPAACYHGSVYGVVPAMRGHLKPVGAWNQEEIFADGPHVRITLNGFPIVDTNLDEVKDPAILKRHPGLHNAKGHIGFLGHGARVEFRNMRVKELPATDSQPAKQ